LSRVKGDLKPTRWIEDCAVPPWRLPQFIDGFKKICDRHGFSAALFGHGGEGNLHVNPFVNVKNAEHRERMRKAADEILELIQKLKGTISGEHGDGIMRSPYLAQQYGDVYPIMVKLKEMFDPRYLLNPLTKIVNEPREVTDFLRCGEDYARVATGTSIDSPAILEEIEKCHGCGKCRTYCPLMRVGKDEKYTARAKANLLRAVIGGRIDASFLVDQEFKDNMDLCISCEQCLVECPTQVDIPGIAMAFREQYVDRKGPGGIVADVMGKPDKIGKAGSKLAGVTNMLLKNRFLRGIAQQVTGLDERRKLPQMQQAQGVRKLAPLEVPPEVRAKLPHEAVVFPGCFAEYYDPDGEKNTLIEILGALGVAVHAPALNCCGISKITKGDSRGARNDLFENVEKLESYVERGAKVLLQRPKLHARRQTRMAQNRGRQARAQRRRRLHRRPRVSSGRVLERNHAQAVETARKEGRLPHALPQQSDGRGCSADETHGFDRRRQNRESRCRLLRPLRHVRPYGGQLRTKHEDRHAALQQDQPSQARRSYVKLRRMPNPDQTRRAELRRNQSERRLARRGAPAAAVVRGAAEEMNKRLEAEETTTIDASIVNRNS
jgi:heterodisulfide reductase subunit C